MPRISAFDGIVITMYFRDHPPPHFHDRARAHEQWVDLADELWGPMGEPLVWPNGFDLDPDVLHGRRSHDLAPAATRQSTA